VLPAGTELDSTIAATNAANREIKEWQAIMDYLVNLPTKNENGISVLERSSQTEEVLSLGAWQAL
jgi:5'-nucleotidase